MAFRRLPEEPISRLAVWAGRFAGFSIPVVLLAIVLVRSGFLEIVPALATFGGALFLAVVAILLALASFVVIWREGLRGLGTAVIAVLIGLGVLAYPAYFAYRGYTLPPISDITTDPIDPPRFEAIARLRPRDANPIAYAGLRAAELQRAAYPRIEPLVVAAAPQQAFDAVMGVLTKRRLRPVDARAPQAGRRDGRIEVVFRTLIMGFRDDVSIRIRPDPDGSRIDIRSASRYGRQDFGTNASRIRGLLEEIETAVVGTEPERAPDEQPAKKGPKAKEKDPQKAKR